MKKDRRSQRIIILSLLSLTVLSPVLFLYSRIGRLPQSSDEILDLVDDVSSIKYHPDNFRLNSLNQEAGDGLNVPARELLKELILIDPSVGGNRSADHVSITGENDKKPIDDPKKLIGVRISSADGAMRQKNRNTSIHRSSTPANEKISNMWDQLIMARAYLQFTPPSSNSRLVRELKLRMKDIKSIVSQVNKDSDLPRSAMQKMRAMEVSLSRASRAYPDCSAMAMKLRAMAYTSEEQLRAQRKQVSYLLDLATRTISKGLHCLSMKLTSRYFDLPLEDRQPPKKVKVNSRRVDLFHMAILSDNILACSVVVKSTVSSSTDPSKLVFHVVTDPLTFPAMTMWFMMNPARPASVNVMSTEDLDFLPVDFDSRLQQQHRVNARFYSPLNHLRFYLPQIFPFLRKVLLVDHDVVVRKDLTSLWRVDLKEKVNGAVETSLRLESFVNFSDPTMAKKFDLKSSAWAFGMNIFDLDQWRRRGLTKAYEKFLQLERPTWKAGTLPLGLLTFYNETRPLKRHWHLQGLGQAPGDASRAEVESAAVIHYDGDLKPWLEVGLAKYKAHWTRYVDYGHPLLRECNIHD